MATRDIEFTHRTCNSCGVEKPLSEYHTRNNRQHNIVSRCKDCLSKERKQYRIDNKEQIRAENKRRNPGWDIDRYNEYLKLQNGLCAICGTDKPGLSDWSCDHCHTENKARGLLCVRCNAGLGQFFDNIDYLNSAVAYLNKWK